MLANVLRRPVLVFAYGEPPPSAQFSHVDVEYEHIEVPAAGAL
jgi:hypothetical protein